MAELSKYVHVAGRLFAPGQILPTDLADQITNPKAWSSEPMKPAEVPVRRPAANTDPRGSGADPEQDSGGVTDPEETSEEEEDPGDAQDGSGDDSPDHEEEVPQRPAKNASESAWRAYILATVDVSEADLEGASRADLIAMDAAAVEEE